MLRFRTGDEQRCSLFFTKLHPDVRREILLQLLGSRHVHVKFASSLSGGSQRFTRHGHPPITYARWLHCVCKPGSKAPPHAHVEQDHKWRYLSVQILFTCKRAFEEGIFFLYSTNTFIFQKSVDLVNFNTTAIAHVRFIRSLDLNIKLGGLRERESPRQEIDAFKLVVSTLSDRAVWCALKQIRIRVQDELDDTPPRRQRKKVRREAKKVFSRAMSTLVGDGRVQVQVIFCEKNENEILKPGLSLQMPGLVFVDDDQFWLDDEWSEWEIDSDFEGAFDELVQMVRRSEDREMR